MKKITILLSSALILFLITGNNASYAPHYKDFSGFQDKKPNKNVFKGQVRKGNVRVLPNRGSYTDSGRITYRPGKDGFIGQTGKNCLVGGTMCSARKGKAKTQIKFRGQEGQSFSRGLHNNGAFREGVPLKFINGKWK